MASASTRHQLDTTLLGLAKSLKFCTPTPAFSRESVRRVVSAHRPTPHIEDDPGNQPTPASSRPTHSRTLPHACRHGGRHSLPCARVAARFVEQGRGGRTETLRDDLLFGLAQPALAGSLRDRDRAVNVSVSSSVIANSTACRHVAMIPILGSDKLKRGIHKHASGSADAGFTESVV